MSTITNKSFWEKEEVIETQDLTETSSPHHEKYLMERVLNHYQSNGITTATIKIFGCGTGREINEIHKTINPDHIVASDISENMIKTCKENLKLWNIENKVSLYVTAAQDFSGENKFETVTILNSMLTYVHKKEDRLTILSKAREILQENGCIIGTVHNQVGVFKKTASLFFLYSISSIKFTFSSLTLDLP